VIDGNDGRGIDVGLMTGKNHPIGLMRSHVDDRDSKGNDIFSRDCPEYAVQLPSGQTLWVLVNHLKSKGYGGKVTSDRKRKAQATRIKAIYEARVAAGDELVAIVGDLNDTPDSDPLSPLLKHTDLKDVSSTLPSTTAATRAPMACATPATRSTTSCCHPSSTSASRQAVSCARACGPACARSAGRPMLTWTTRRTPRPTTPHFGSISISEPLQTRLAQRRRPTLRRQLPAGPEPTGRSKPG
jgi:hypothetical protein